MLVGVMPTQLTYCVTFIGYQYISWWCSRRRHCVTDRSGSANHQPAYLPLASYITARHLSSSNSDQLNEPPARIAIGERRFSHYTPRIWNSLPTTVRSADSYDSFKTRLICLTLSDVEERSVTDPCPWIWIFIYRNGHIKSLWLIDWLIVKIKDYYRHIPSAVNIGEKFFFAGWLAGGRGQVPLTCRPGLWPHWLSCFLATEDRKSERRMRSNILSVNQSISQSSKQASKQGIS